MHVDPVQLESLNREFREAPPRTIIAWALTKARRPVLTTNFRPYEAAILQAVYSVDPKVPVIWCDTGYNTPHTYRHAEALIRQLDLDIRRYIPRQTAAHREALMGIPGIDDPRHQEFTRQVKLEPFQRAMREFQPDVWFTNLRKGQTAHRDGLGVVSLSRDGVLKVSPFYHWEDARLNAYLSERGLPNEFRYHDPTKVLENRECGLHT